MKSPRTRITILLDILALEALVAVDPIRPWLPFSLWTATAEDLSLQGIVAYAALALLGAFLPFPFPGLRPLPSTLPLIGAGLLLLGLPPAAALAAATVLLPFWRRQDEAPAGQEPRAPWPATLAGMGLGLVIASISGLVLPAEPFARGSLEIDSILTAWFVLTVACAAAVFTARALAASDKGEPWHRGWTTALCAAPAASGLALVAAQAVRVWGVGPVSLWLLPPLAAMSPLAMAVSRQRRETLSQKRIAEGLMEILEALALAIEAKDRTSARHIRRMRALAGGLGRRLGMSAAELAPLDLAALLHDVGKLAVPEWILSKPGRLTEEEHQKMTLHSETAAGLLETVPLTKEAATLVRHHHEHYDGSGYPAGLTGMAIPLGARILTVVDALDSIMSDRSYHRAVSRDEALTFLRANAGVLFDPRVVKCLLENFDALQAEADAACAGAPPARPAAAPVRSARIQDVLDMIASSHMEVYSLHEIALALGKAFKLEESLALIAGRISNLFHFTSCAIYVADGERGVLVPRLTAGRGADLIRSLEIPFGEGIAGWCAREHRTILVGPAPDEQFSAGAAADLAPIAENEEIAALTCCLAAPLMADQEVIGVIALFDTTTNPYTPPEERLLGMVGRQVGTAVRNGLLLERTQEHTLTDFLTGLPNTRYMFVMLEEQFARVRESGEPLSILLMDLDGFGHVNEEHGRPVGDRYLIGAAKAIRSQMRDRDTCIRYSGDEFVAILPGVGREEAEAVAERIRKAMEEFSIDGRGGKRVGLTISIGHATFSLDGETFETMIAAADERLAVRKAEYRTRALAGASLIPFRRRKQPSNN